MVDPVGASGQVQNILNSSGKSQKSEVTEEKKVEAQREDEVRLSDEALSLSRAEEKAQDTRVALQEDQSQTLSADQKRLSTLV